MSLQNLVFPKSSVFLALRLKGREIRNCRKHVTLKKRHPLSMYSSHKLHDNMESYNPNDSDDGCYSLRCLIEYYSEIVNVLNIHILDIVTL